MPLRIPKKAILAQQRIPKIDVMTANLTVVLWKREYGDYSTVIRNDDDGSYIHGHYNLTLPDAWSDFGQRVASNWPKVNDEFVDEDATIESVRKGRSK